MLVQDLSDIFYLFEKPLKNAMTTKSLNKVETNKWRLVLLSIYNSYKTNVTLSLVSSKFRWVKHLCLAIILPSWEACSYDRDDKSLRDKLMYWIDPRFNSIPFSINLVYSHFMRQFDMFKSTKLADVARDVPSFRQLALESWMPLMLSTFSLFNSKSMFHILINLQFKFVKRSIINPDDYLHSEMSKVSRFLNLWFKKFLLRFQ